MATQMTRPDIMQAALASNTNGKLPWHAAYPKARSDAKPVSRDDVLRLVKSDTAPGDGFVLVDLRRDDFEGGTILGSINLPAQSIFQTIPSLYNLFKAAGTRKVIWYCGQSDTDAALARDIICFCLWVVDHLVGSSLHRGNLAAAWFDDYIAERSDTAMQSLVLTGGIKGWAAAKGEFVRYMQDYDESKW